jgi:CheY-like chemotaxis protein
MRNWRVLVVEDEPDGQAVVTSLLGHYQINAEAVDNAEEALHSLSRDQYDAIVIDLMLPGMDGLELVQMIRRDPATRDLPCLAITAYHTSRVKADALDFGFDGYFAKPLKPDIFVGRLNQLMSN